MYSKPIHMMAAAEGSPFMDPAMANMGIRQMGMPPAQDGNKHSADRRFLEQSWKDPNFSPISKDNVIFYFCRRENPFYDSNSDNAIILGNALNQDINTENLGDFLRQMNGTQFVLVTGKAPLFIIRKHHRESPDRIHPLCQYYVLDGTVYQAPDLYTLTNSRLINVMDPLKQAFSEALDMLKFSPSKGYSWEFKTKPSKRAEDEQREAEEAAGEEASKGRPMMSAQSSTAGTSSREVDGEDEDPLNVRATPYQRLRTEMLLRELTERFKTKNIDTTSIAAGNLPASKGQQKGAGTSAPSFDSSIPVPPLVNFPGLFYGHGVSSDTSANIGVGDENNQHGG